MWCHSVPVSDRQSALALHRAIRGSMDEVGRFMNEEYGYIAIRSTRPGLVGVTLADSPVAQLAWMLDKFPAWTWPLETLPDEILGRERILANASLCWLGWLVNSSNIRR